MNDILSRLEARIWRSLKKNRHICPAGSHIVVAVSGGPDSVALLRLLASLTTRHKLDIHLHVAHFNHAQRGPESEEDAKFVESLAGKLKLPFHMKRLESEVMLKGRGLEDNLRRLRYKFLIEVASEVGARVILLAHNADDNVETVVMRFLRGTNLNGLTGIRQIRSVSLGIDGTRKSFYFARPLLSTKKSEILEYNKAAKIEFRTDSSNNDNALRRNWVRNVMLPQVRDNFNGGIDKVVLQFSEQMISLEGYMQEVISSNYPVVVSRTSDVGLSLNVSEMLKRHPAIVQEIIVRAIRHLAIKGATEYRHIKAIHALAHSDRPDAQISLPGGYIALRKGQAIEIVSVAEMIRRDEEAKKRREIDTKREIPIPVPGMVNIPNIGSIRTQVLPFYDDFMDKFVEQKTNLEEFVDSDKIVLPLVFRYPKPDDTFWPLGQQKPRRLASFLKDARVPLNMRDVTPLVCDAEKIIWVVKTRVSEAVKFERGGKTHKTIRLSLKEI